MAYKKLIPKNQKVTNSDKLKTCSSCNKKMVKENNFYKSTNPLDSDGLTNQCKKCINEHVDPNDLESVKSMLANLNKPFLHSVWLNSYEEAEKLGRSAFGVYLKTIFLSYKELTYKDSEFSSLQTIEKQQQQINNQNYVLKDNELEVLMHESDRKNKEDVIRLLGYDPFYFESEFDKKQLYNKLIDFLDESTLEDGFKLSAVIEIVTVFNQIDKINAAIASITKDAQQITGNTGGISTLAKTKDGLLKSALALAKDNGISVNNNNNKSKGAGTLAGIIKQLQEKGVESAEVNLYDIETCDGMKQVADISNKSIFEQLMLNENDYVDMIKDQRELIQGLTNKAEKLEEENRQLKIKLKYMEIEERKKIQVIDGTEIEDV